MTTKPTVLVRGESNHLLDKHFKVISLQKLLDNEASPEDVDGIVISKYFANVPEFRTELLPRMTRLKVVTPLGIGIDAFEDLMEDFRKRSVVVALNTGDKEMCAAVADFAIGLMLSCSRAISAGAQFIKATKAETLTQWLPYKNALPKYTHPVTGKCIGIIGMGTIGFQIAKRAFHGFNMNILYTGRSQKPAATEKVVEAEYHATLDTMLPLCDYVMVSCSSNVRSRKLLGSNEFRMMKSNCIVVNIARGDIIDTDALTEALQAGRIAGAGLDVTWPEPLQPGHPLLEMERVVVTPHIAWALQDVKDELLQSQCQNLVSVLIEGKPPKLVAT